MSIWVRKENLMLFLNDSSGNVWNDHGWSWPSLLYVMGVLSCIWPQFRHCCFWSTVNTPTVPRDLSVCCLKEFRTALKSLPFQTIHLWICRRERLLSLPQCFPQTARQTGILVLFNFLPKMQKGMCEIVTHPFPSPERVECNAFPWYVDCVWCVLA